MAVLIRNNIIIANSIESYEALLKKPKINDHEVEEENTSTSLEVMWIGTSDEYMAMPRKNPNTFYMITDSLMPIMPDTYERYENKPKIAGVELTPDTTIEDLDIYTRDEIQALIRQSGAILVVPESVWEQIEDDPSIARSNTIYYVETENEGVYRSYSIDANFIIKYLGTNEAAFVDYQMKKPVIKNGSVVVPEIKVADNTVEGAIKTLGDTTTATTTAKDNAVNILKEINNDKLDGVQIIKRAQQKFGTWSGTAQNCQYKLATILINDVNSVWAGSFKILNSYKELDLTGTEFKISLQGGNRSIDDVAMYEMSATGVPEGTPSGKAIVWLCYSRALAWPQTVEVWLQLLNVKWHEFEGEWLVKSSQNTGFILAEDTIYPTPANDAAFKRASSGQWTLDLGKQRAGLGSISGKVNSVTTLTNMTRDSLNTSRRDYPEFMFPLVKFAEGEGPNGDKTSIYNVHVLASGSGVTMHALNLDTGRKYKCQKTSSGWSTWIGFYGIDGETIGGLNKSTSAPKMDTLWRMYRVYPSKAYHWTSTFDAFEWDYQWIDMGGYYLNSIHFVGTLGISYVYPGDGEVMFKLTEVKGYPIMKGYSYANSYMGTDDEYVGVEGYTKTQLLNDSRYMTETTLRLDKDGNVIPGFRAFSNGFNNNPTKNMRYPSAQGEKYRGAFFFISKKTND